MARAGCPFFFLPNTGFLFQGPLWTLAHRSPGHSEWHFPSYSKALLITAGWLLWPVC